MRTVDREEGLWVVLNHGPSPWSDFVEMEDEAGRGVGPESGVGWKREGRYWLLGPFQPAVKEQTKEAGVGG